MPNSTTIAANVSQGKPKVGGAVFIADTTATLPTDATTPLANTFTSLGHLSEDGYTISTSFKTVTIKSWSGDVVHTSSERESETSKMTLIETLSTPVLKTVYGDSAVTTVAGATSVASSPKAPAEKVLVIEEILKGNIARRTVIPKATLSDLGDIVHKGDDLIAYPCTFTHSTDANGNFHYEYTSAGTGAGAGDN